MAIKEMVEARVLLSPLASATAQSASFVSNVFNVQQFCNYALQIIIASQSSLNVDIKVQGSIDGVNYADVPSSTTNFTANGTFIWTASNSPLMFVRLNFGINAGSALFQAYGFAKTQ